MEEEDEEEVLARAVEQLLKVKMCESDELNPFRGLNNHDCAKVVIRQTLLKLGQRSREHILLTVKFKNIEFQCVIAPGINVLGGGV